MPAGQPASHFIQLKTESIKTREQKEIQQLRSQVKSLQAEVDRLKKEQAQRQQAESKSSRRGNGKSTIRESAAEDDEYGYEDDFEREQAVESAKTRSRRSSEATVASDLFTWHRAGQLETEVLELTLKDSDSNIQEIQETLAAQEGRLSQETLRIASHPMPASTSNFYQLTVAISQSKLLQLENNSTTFRSISLAQPATQITPLASPTQPCYGPALCYIAPKSMVLLTGGSAKGVYLKSCEVYSVKTDRWKAVAEMNFGRHQHASCFLGDQAYVFCGYSRSQGEAGMTTIEKMSIDAMDAWTVIQIADTVLAARCYPVVAPIGPQQIAIIGGYDGSDYVSSAVVLDTMTHSCQKLVERDPSLAFYAFGNQSISAHDSSIVALVKSHSAKAQVIAFSAADNKLRVVHELTSH